MKKCLKIRMDFFSYSVYILEIIIFLLLSFSMIFIYFKYGEIDFISFVALCFFLYFSVVMSVKLFKARIILDDEKICACYFVKRKEKVWYKRIFRPFRIANGRHYTDYYYALSSFEILFNDIKEYGYAYNMETRVSKVTKYDIVIVSNSNKHFRVPSRQFKGGDLEKIMDFIYSKTNKKPKTN